MSIDTQGIVLDFGKHKSTLLTRIPVGYLRWMCNEFPADTRWGELARAEFERRGDTMPVVELTGHAIDNASLRVRREWHQTSNEGEGLYSWLQRMTLEALRDGEEKDGKIHYNGLRLVIAQGEEFPTLMTIMPGKRKHKHALVKEAAE